MRDRTRLRGLLVFLASMLLLATLFYTLPLLTAFLLRQLHVSLPAPALRVIDPMLGLLIIGAIGNLLARRMARQDPFQDIRDALARIAAGDFGVRLGPAQGRPLHELVDSVNEMAAKLGQVEAMRQEFVANVSHEIQSPLTSIRGFAQALQDERLSAEQRTAYLQIIEAESIRLSRMSDNLLTLAALEAAEGAPAMAPYRLDRQIRDLILACEPQWRDKEIEWDLRLEKTTVTAHEALLGQVWLNLLQNAIKFSHQGGAIAVELTPAGADLCVTISDHGIGIAPEDQLRIFERFFKADKARDRAMGGSGLGLAITRKIVTMHGGRISVQSRLGAGTTFTVTLPFRSPAV